MFIVNAPLTFIIITSCIVFGEINRRIMNKTRKPQKEVRKAIGGLTAFIENTISAMDTVKTFSAKKYIQKMFKNEKIPYNSNGLTSEKIDAGRMALYRLFNNFIIYGGVFYLGVRAINGEMTVGEVFAYIYLLSQVLIPVEVLFSSIPKIIKADVAWSRVYEILDIPQQIETNLLCNWGDLQELTVENINFSYDENFNILNEINFKLLRGRLNVLVGESGKGKSTLLKVLLGLYGSPSANYRINGEQTKICSLNGVSSFAPSGNHMFNISIYENISLGNESITKEMCMELLEELGLSDWINSLTNKLDTIVTENATNLSGGQQQMISNMRAILSGHSIVIMDEPFSALDKDKEGRLLRLLDRLKDEKVFLFTSHRDSTIQSCENIIEL